MAIDGFTLVAQAINFLILVWLLQRFLYQPILEAMGERQRRVTEQTQKADAARSAAEEEGRRLAGLTEAFEGQRGERLTALQTEVETRRGQLLEELRKEISSLRTRWQNDLAWEQGQQRERMVDLIRREVFGLAGQVLHDLADATLEERMVSAFLQRLRSRTPQEEADLAGLRQTGSGGLRIRTAFPLSETQRQHIQTALGAVPEALRFELAPELLGGIECATDGGKISLTLAGELHSLEERLADLLRQDGAPQTHV